MWSGPQTLPGLQGLQESAARIRGGAPVDAVDLVRGQAQPQGNGRPLLWDPGHDPQEVRGEGRGLQTSSVQVTECDVWGPETR